MLALEAWGSGRFKPLVMFAHVVALNAKACHDFILQSRGRPLLTLAEAQGIKIHDWLQLYRRPSFVEGALIAFLHSPESLQSAEEEQRDYRFSRRAAKLQLHEEIHAALTGGVSAKMLARSERWVDRIYKRFHLPMIDGMLRGDEPVPENFRDWIARPEFIFFASVAMPCWLEFHRTPWVLYRQACRGKFQSLEQLLRLDPEIDKDLFLRGQMFRIRKQNSGRYDMLQRARCEGRKTPVSLADVKFLLGGLLMKWSAEWQAIMQGELIFEAVAKSATSEKKAVALTWIKHTRERASRSSIKCRLQAPDIKGLFDAVAKDSDEGLVDIDFCQQSNSIYKRLRRNAGVWPKMRETDIRRAS